MWSPDCDNVVMRNKDGSVTMMSVTVVGRFLAGLSMVTDKKNSKPIFSEMLHPRCILHTNVPPRPVMGDDGIPTDFEAVWKVDGEWHVTTVPPSPIPAGDVTEEEQKMLNDLFWSACGSEQVIVEMKMYFAHCLKHFEKGVTFLHMLSGKGGTGKSVAYLLLMGAVSTGPPTCIDTLKRFLEAEDSFNSASYMSRVCFIQESGELNAPNPVNTALMGSLKCAVSERWRQMHGKCKDKRMVRMSTRFVVSSNWKSPLLMIDGVKRRIVYVRNEEEPDVEYIDSICDIMMDNYSRYSSLLAYELWKTDVPRTLTLRDFSVNHSQMMVDNTAMRTRTNPEETTLSFCRCLIRHIANGVVNGNVEADTTAIVNGEILVDKLLTVMSRRRMGLSFESLCLVLKKFGCVETHYNSYMVPSSVRREYLPETPTIDPFVEMTAVQQGGQQIRPQMAFYRYLAANLERTMVDVDDWPKYLDLVATATATAASELPHQLLRQILDEQA